MKSGIFVKLFTGILMRKPSIIILLSLLCIVSACVNHHINAVLDDIETYIQERPDSALVVLESIPRESLESSKSQAQYSLLYVIALDKNYIDTTDLSIILPASDYYSKRGPSVSKIRTLFYQGRIHANRGEDDRALHYYLLALEDSSYVDDNHYKELVNSAIADVFSRSHYRELELQYAKDALRYGRLAGDTIGVWAITGLIASAYGNLGMWDEAEDAYQRFFEMPIYDSLTYFRKKVNYAKDLLRVPDSSPQLSVELLETVANSFPKAMSIEAYCIYAFAQQKLGNEAAANDILTQLKSLNRQQDIVKLWRYRIYRDQGKYDQAIADLEQSVLVQDSIVLSVLRQSLIQSQHDYLKSETLVLKKENELEKQRIALILIVSLVIMGLFALLYFKRKAAMGKKIDELSALHRESQQMLDLQSAQAASANAKLAQKEADLFSLRKQFASMYKAQYKTLNDLCAAYLSPIKKDRKDIIYDEVMSQLCDIINDEDSQNRFMSMVNASLDGIMDKLHQDLPKHKEQDFRFLMYIIVGFDATTISNLTDYSVGTVYTKKNRLKGEISALNSPYRDFYLEYID